MSAIIVIEEPYQSRHLLNEKIKWVKNRVPSNEFRVEFGHTTASDIGGLEYISKVRAEVVVWSDDAEKVAFDYWWNH